MKRILVAAFSFVLLSFAITSCVSNKDMTYLQGIDSLYAQLKPINADYNLVIGADDQLAISASSTSQTALAPFNNVVLIGSGSTTGGSTANTQAGVSYFTVDKHGDIRFPVFGKMHVGGLTVEQFADRLKDSLRTNRMISDAVVTVKIMSFKVSVLGAVAHPGVVQYTNGQRLTLLEAIAQAGDLTNTALRKDIKVIREVDGKRISYSVDLTNPKSVFNSPAYFMKQNDMVYVEANKSERVKGSVGYTYLGIAGSLIGIVASMASLIISLTR